jgi:hypothetical protein
MRFDGFAEPNVPLWLIFPSHLTTHFPLNRPVNNRKPQYTTRSMHSAFSSFFPSVPAGRGFYPKFENTNQDWTFPSTNCLVHPILNSPFTDSHYMLPARACLPTSYGSSSTLSMLLGSHHPHRCSPPFPTQPPPFPQPNPPSATLFLPPHRSIIPDQRARAPIPSFAPYPPAPCAEPLLSKVFPRRRLGQKPSFARKAPVLLSRPIIAQHFGSPLAEAAARLGICSTALKSACRSGARTREAVPGAALLRAPCAGQPLLRGAAAVRCWDAAAPTRPRALAAAGQGRRPPQPRALPSARRSVNGARMRCPTLRPAPPRLWRGRAARPGSGGSADDRPIRTRRITAVAARGGHGARVGAS